MKKKSIYIAGKISGLDPMFVFHHFSFAEYWLEKTYSVENPVRFCPRHWGWFRCMVKCIYILAGCQAIYLLNDWNHSRGAKIELLVAILMNKQILKQS